jgi:sugar lactone lactonase YvrE
MNRTLMVGRTFWFFVAILCVATTPNAQVITTVAGGFVGDGGPATSAALDPNFLARDTAGNLYITDFSHNRIRKVTTSGVITTVAGTGISGFSGDGGPATAATLGLPRGIAVDSAGNLYIADGNINHRIRKVNTSGIITTIAGNGTPGSSGDGGPASSATVNSPGGLRFDSAGNLYFADTLAQVVRRIDTFGTITTVAGNGIAGFSGDGGSATAATLNFPRDIALDPAGNLYIADVNNFRVRKVNTLGVISTAVGGGVLIANLDLPTTLTFDSSGNLYIATFGLGHRVRKVNSAFTAITDFAGVADSAADFNGDGLTALSTFFGRPFGLVFDTAGNLLVSDIRIGRVRKIDSSTQIVSTVAGGFIGDGNPGMLAHLKFPQQIALDSAGNLYITDLFNHRVRKLAKSGTITTFAGIGIQGYSGDGGPAIAAAIDHPLGVAVNPSGEVFISDNNEVIRKVDTQGNISTFWATSLDDDIVQLAFDAFGNLYVAGLCAVRKIDPSGTTVTTFAGQIRDCGFFGDRKAATKAKLLFFGYGLAFDSQGNLYISDGDNQRVRKVDTSGIITTVAGTGKCGFSGDGGPATSARLCNPTSVAVDLAGNLYIADYANRRIRKVNTAGTITTIAATGAFGFNGHVLPAAAVNIDGPFAVAVDTHGNVYVADDQNYLIRKITSDPVVALDGLTALVDSLQLQGGLGTGLKAKLRDAQNLLQAGDRQGALQKLQVFISEVNAQRDKLLTQSQADQLIAGAQAVMGLI